MKTLVRTFAAALFALAALHSAVALAQDAKLLARGTYLMNSIVACGNCHVQRDPTGKPLADRGLSGGMLFDEEPFKAYAPNITPDRETGIGKWTDAQLARAIREGIRPDGSPLKPPMAFGWYKNINDADMKALAAYLKSMKPLPMGAAK